MQFFVLCHWRGDLLHSSSLLEPLWVWAESCLCRSLPWLENEETKRSSPLKSMPPAVSFTASTFKFISGLFVHYNCQPKQVLHPHLSYLFLDCLSIIIVCPNKFFMVEIFEMQIYMLSFSLISFIYLCMKHSISCLFYRFSDLHTMLKCLFFVVVRVLNFPLLSQLMKLYMQWLFCL